MHVLLPIIAQMQTNRNMCIQQICQRDVQLARGRKLSRAGGGVIFHGKTRKIHLGISGNECSGYVWGVVEQEGRIFREG